MEINKLIDQNFDNLIKDLSNLIAFPSRQGVPEEGAPFGKDIADALHYILAVAEKMGFQTKNLDDYIGIVDFGSGDETIGVLTHLDIVHEGDGWDTDPFVATIKDGNLYGRGSSDNKGPSVATLYALYSLKESGFIPSKKIRIIYGCDEETGWNDLAYYCKHEKMPETAFSPDGCYPLVNSERGIMQCDITATFDDAEKPARIISVSGGTGLNVVPAYARAVLTGIAMSAAKSCADNAQNLTKTQIELTQDGENINVLLKGTQSHAARPMLGNNALTAMLVYLTSLPVDECQGFTALKKLAKAYSHNCFDGASAGVACQNEEMGELSMALTMMQFDEESVSAAADIRYPNCTTHNQLIDKLNETIGLSVTQRTHKAPHFVSPKSELVKTLLRVYEEQSGKEGYCITIGGGTYARAIENAVTFGCEFPGEPDVAHQANEYTNIENLRTSTKIIANSIMELSK